MSDRAEGTSAAHAQDSGEVYDREIRRRFPPAEAEPMIAFARGLFAHEGARYAAELGEKGRLALVASAFRFFALPPDRAPCRLRTPTLPSDGWNSPYTIFESHLTDRPFIVDTIREFLHRRGTTVRYLLHPIYSVERDAAGAIVRMRSLDNAAQKESFVHCAVDRLPGAELGDLERRLADCLGDLRAATDDYRKMRDQLAAVEAELASSPGPETEEARQLLGWLGDGNFVFLGYGWVEPMSPGDASHPRLVESSTLGILRRPARAREIASRDLEEATDAPEPHAPLAVTRSSVEATVHRFTRMDMIVVRRVEAGRVGGEHRFFGLFTSKAHTDTPAEIPLLRRKLARILAAEQALPDSHDFRQIVSIFEAMPKVELFQLTVEEIRAEIATLRSLGPSEGVRVWLHSRPGAVWVTVAVPRERFSSDVRRWIEDLLVERLGAPLLDYQLALGEGERVRLHFHFGAPARTLRIDEIESRIAERVRSWDDRLRECLVAAHGAERGRELAERYASLFTPEYKSATDATTAVNDVRHIEALGPAGSVGVDLSDAVGADADRFTLLKLYLRGEGIVLSDFLPLLENLGLRVFAEDSVALGPQGDQRIVVVRFWVQKSRGERLDVARLSPTLVPAMVEIHARRVESDPLNRLIVEAEFGWREVDLLRAYRNAAFQTGATPSRPALDEALLRRPEAARALFDLFVARFDPARTARDAGAKTARDRLAKTLEAVDTEAEDQVLRNLGALVEATLRTNFFRPVRTHHPFVSLKIHSQRVDFLPRPRPLYEIHVHSARMEGVHLRGGKVARGGIRWSDRPDDFRTEILGLMKTQMVKNAVIVPVGSKGGFIVKRPRPGDGAGAEVHECYATLMRGLLEITDNVVRREVVPPRDVVRYDADDPYLVVAADKGTATFSDLANSIAEECGFWLGDAFASGGSSGYDHKREGITARGAWRCVERHFRDLGKDIRDAPFDVVGIGDMSGDVFGNGMLLSTKIRLRAAFNHAHIFLDPNPDPETALRERERLFRLPRSAWADYDRSRLSAGGMIVARAAKAAALSNEVRALLGVDAKRLHGEGLIRAILKMKADLLFNGGIGTYVRASGETDVEVGDHANDGVRIAAAEVGATVICEGGNLGLTQRARVEFALQGRRINTDAIDNSGGVDLSDHEVNLKILFQPLLETGKLTLAQRNRLLEECKEEVISHVLAHNERQALLLSLDERRSRTRESEFLDQIGELESEGALDRTLEYLPDRESLRQRRGVSPGLTRPELAVLAAYSKLQLQRKLIASRWIDDPVFERYLFAYFPAAVAERFADAVREHRLRREIIATEVANQVVDRLGSAFAQRMLRDTADDAATAVASYVAVVAITEADRVFDAIADSTSAASTSDVYELCLSWEAAIESACKVLLTVLRRGAALSERIPRWRDALTELADREAPDEAGEAAAEALERLGIEVGVARSLLALERLHGVLQVVRVAEDRDIPLGDASELYRKVGGMLDFASLDGWFAAVSGENRWDKRAAEALREDLAAARRRMTATIFAQPQKSLAVRLSTFLQVHEGELARLRALIEEFAARRQTSIAAMVVVVRELWKLAGRS